MTDDFFLKLCDVYGFAPSRALRELVDSAIGQALVIERHACAKVCQEFYSVEGIAQDCAAAIRERGQS